MLNTMANTLDHKKILKQVLEMKQKLNEATDVSTKSQEHKSSLASEFNYLYTHVPSLFEMVYQNDAPYMQHLEVIMSNFSKINGGGLDHKNATENVVNHLNKTFIDDKHRIKEDKDYHD
jgi:hypothetical protein